VRELCFTAADVEHAHTLPCAGLDGVRLLEHESAAQLQRGRRRAPLGDRLPDALVVGA
jgi:hypothetical protein